MQKSLACLFLIMGLLACSKLRNRTGIACTMEAAISLSVKVKDVNTGRALTDSVLVTATLASKTFTLDPFPPDSVFLGPAEVDGDFVISVTRPRYKSFTSGVVHVSKDKCHVKMEKVTVELSPR